MSSWSRWNVKAKIKNEVPSSRVVAMEEQLTRRTPPISLREHASDFVFL